jgi:saccharopine dehydrogenase-like NADP-dependent oxidoreductase
MPDIAKKFKAMIDLGLWSSDEIEIDGIKVKPRKVLGELLQRIVPADEAD